MDIVTVPDVELHLGETLDPTEVEQVSGFIRLATALARDRVPTLDARLESEVPRDIIRGVLIEVVARALDTVRIGRRTRSLQFPEVLMGYADAAGVVYLTDVEVRQMSGTSRGSRGAFTVVPG